MKYVHYFILGIVVAAVLITTVHADTFDVPSLKPYVNDFTNTLSSSDIAHINELCDIVDQETSAEIAVLVVNLSTDTDINEYATTVFEKNAIGKKGKDNGVLLIVNPTNNDWVVQVGYGLEGVLNDAKLAYIGRTYLEPSIDTGEYATGIYDTVAIIGETISENTEPVHRSWFDEHKYFIYAIIILIVILIITRGRAFLWFGDMIGKGFGGGKTGGGMGKR
jgi:uncharacterized protein